MNVFCKCGFAAPPPHPAHDHERRLKEKERDAERRAVLANPDSHHNRHAENCPYCAAHQERARFDYECVGCGRNHYR